MKKAILVMLVSATFFTNLSISEAEKTSVPQIKSIVYTVKEGESLWSIAQDHREAYPGLSVKEIIKVIKAENDLCMVLRTNQEIVLREQGDNDGID